MIVTHWSLYSWFAIVYFVIAVSPSQQGTAGHVEARGDIRGGGWGPGVLCETHSPNWGQLLRHSRAMTFGICHPCILFLALAFYRETFSQCLLSDPYLKSSLSWDATLTTEYCHMFGRLSWLEACDVVLLGPVCSLTVYLVRIASTFGVFALFLVCSQQKRWHADHLHSWVVGSVSQKQKTKSHLYSKVSCVTTKSDDWHECVT